MAAVNFGQQNRTKIMLPFNWLQDPDYTLHYEHQYRELRYFVRYKTQFVGYCNTREKAGLNEIVVPENRLPKIR